ncbi:hypothetical protein CC79DRAFT_1277976 [Sarocladium strictum]
MRKVFESTKSSISPRVVGFQLVRQDVLDASDLSSSCASTLAKAIDCDEHVAGLGERQYHGALEDDDLTKAICSTTCQNALKAAEHRINGACASTPELFPGIPVVSLLYAVISGWNETCLQDPESGINCNDIIDSWDDYEDLDDMPKSELCSYCFGARLRMMQASAYSVYDELFAEMLKHVNKECGVQGPTDPIVPEPLCDNDEDEDYLCDGGETHTSKEGDTCDSIAQAHSVSASSLYYINADLVDCNDVWTGQRLCLPDACETVHIVQEGETCKSIAREYGVSPESIVDWNVALDSTCSNIWAENPFWGRTICVSPPGGRFKDGGGGGGDDPGANLGREGGSGNGYSDWIDELPQGSIGTNTTIYCGFWIQASSANEGACAKMLISTPLSIPINLFLKVNPSLGTAVECDEKLEEGTWYCLSPVYGWEDMEEAKIPLEDREL